MTWIPFKSVSGVIFEIVPCKDCLPGHLVKLLLSSVQNEMFAHQTTVLSRNHCAKVFAQNLNFKLTLTFQNRIIYNVWQKCLPITEYRHTTFKNNVKKWIFVKFLGWNLHVFLLKMRSAFKTVRVFISRAKIISIQTMVEKPVAVFKWKHST